MFQRWSLLLILAVASATMTGLIVGYDLCVVSTLLNTIGTDLNVCPTRRVSSGKTFLYRDSFTCGKQSLIVSALAPGAMIGSLSAGLLSDILGRRRTFFIADVLFLLGSIIFFLGPSYSHILLGRFILGAGVGVGFVIFSTYIPEIAPEKHRGKLVAIQDGALSLGCFFSFCLLTFFPASSWRKLIGCIAFAATVQLLLVFYIPESPQWLVKKGRASEAVENLFHLLPDGDALKLSDPETNDGVHCKEKLKKCFAVVERIENNFRLHQEMRQRLRPPAETSSKHDKCTEDSMQNSNKEGSNFLEHPTVEIEAKVSHQPPSSTTQSHQDSPKVPLDIHETYQHDTLVQSYYRFKRKCLEYKDLCKLHRKWIGIAVGCACAQNLMIGNTLIYYMVPIFQKKLVFRNIKFVSFGIGMSKLVGITAAIFLVDRIGRRPLLLCGSICTCIQHLVFSILFFTFDRYRFKVLSIGGITLNLFIFIFWWNVSWAGLMFVVASEVLPLSVRSIGMSLTITTFWLLSFLFQSLFGYVFDFLTFPGAFLLFAFCNLFTILFVVYCIPDLKGLSLDDIEKAALEHIHNEDHVESTVF